LTAVGTVGAVVIALILAIWGDPIRAWAFRPKLDISIKMKPPDCHRIQTTLEGLPGGRTAKLETYYCRMQVWNRGNQQARNVIAYLGWLKFLIRDRDAKFSKSFDEVFRSEGIRIIRTPIKAPRANAVCERWIGSLRRECVDRLLIFGRGHLVQVLTEYLDHFNRHRPHRSLDQRAPQDGDQPPRMTPASLIDIRRRDRLGGLLHEYEWAA